mmetsp:Transcript_8411/g.23714  ORF Transcript_8411/g.23714 Transcript_8411/m.23714 type:complete len:205 (+) Transcript_8411:1579-2193(+)
MPTPRHRHQRVVVRAQNWGCRPIRTRMPAGGATNPVKTRGSPWQRTHPPGKRPPYALRTETLPPVSGGTSGSGASPFQRRSASTTGPPGPGTPIPATASGLLAPIRPAPLSGTPHPPPGRRILPERPSHFPPVPRHSQPVPRQTRVAPPRSPPPPRRRAQGPPWYKFRALPQVHRRRGPVRRLRSSRRRLERSRRRLERSRRML